jgi:hypothetical protein
MKAALALLLTLVAMPACAQDDFGRAIFAEIEQSVRAEYEAMLVEITRATLANPAQDEAEQARRTQRIELETERIKTFAYNKAALFAICASESEKARGPRAPRIRSGQNLVLRTCVEYKLEGMRKFSNFSSYASLFFPERIAPCGERSRLPEWEKVLPPYAFLQLAEPKLYDFERYSACIMTQP